MSFALVGAVRVRPTTYTRHLDPLLQEKGRHERIERTRLEQDSF